nr:isoform 3 of nuclear factor nf-kappa-b p105 [Quercus suber]
MEMEWISDWLQEQDHIKKCEETSIFNLDKAQRRLFKSAVNGDWEDVLVQCEGQNWAFDVKVTKSDDTIFHLAAYNKREDIFERLLKLLPRGTDHEHIAMSALEKANMEGNTPLHIAASVGSKKMCRSIVERSRSSRALLSVLNNKGETPFFSAALHGHKDAFLYLASICNRVEGYFYSQRNDGDTILHCAISAEHYELSIIILDEYEHLVNVVNKDGNTPLHLLARKPSAFKSGSDLRWYEKIIYHSFLTIDDVEKVIKDADRVDLEREQANHGGRPSLNEAQSKLPHIYKACFEFVKLVSKAVLSIFVFSSICYKKRKPPRREADTENPQEGDLSPQGDRGPRLAVPPNYKTCCSLVGLVSKAVLTIFGSDRAWKVWEKKVRHTWSILIMNKLLHHTSMYQLPASQEPEKKKEFLFQSNAKSDATPILIAAKNGISEMVKKTLKRDPMAMYDVDEKKKNIVLLSVEHKQPHVYELLLTLEKENIIKKSIFYEVDDEGNNALHLAAMKAEFDWPVPGGASQMQWEIRWYEYIQRSMPRRFPFLCNKKDQTPEVVFTENHVSVVTQGRDWLSSTSEACSVVAGLFVSITFSTATSVPDDVKDNKHVKASKIFAASSFLSFYTSLIAVVMFLSILTSGCKERDFRRALPWKLLLGLIAFYMSIASTLVSFTTGHFFIFRAQLKFVSSTSYIVTYLLVTVSSMAVFPLFFHLMWATFKKVPQRKYRVTIPHWLYLDE